MCEFLFLIRYHSDKMDFFNASFVFFFLNIILYFVRDRASKNLKCIKCLDFDTFRYTCKKYSQAKYEKSIEVSFIPSNIFFTEKKKKL